MKAPCSASEDSGLDLLIPDAQISGHAVAVTIAEPPLCFQEISREYRIDLV
jgi:hypothetical protein